MLKIFHGQNVSDIFFKAFKFLFSKIIFETKICHYLKKHDKYRTQCLAKTLKQRQTKLNTSRPLYQTLQINRFSL